MPNGLKSRLIDKSSRKKTVEETLKVYEHKCTAECFKPPRKRTPPGLRRVSLGYIYMSSDGGFYAKWGEDEWLPVEGMDFVYRLDGELIRMFNPTVQFHIHSPGGKTISKAITEKEIKPDEKYHAQEVAKIRKRKGDNLKDTVRFFGTIARDEIHYAPKKRKPSKGTGRGAPGQPRSPFSKQVVSLRDNEMTEHEIVEEMIKWLRKHGQSVTPLDRSSIKRRVHFWFKTQKKKLEHK
jgi:hypothetical protein